MRDTRAAHVLAPAKINLWLDVLGRRPDGYHELDSGMLALELCDRVSARATDSGGIELALDGPALSDDVPADARNLAWRAAERARAELVLGGAVEPRVGLALRLEKRIPSQSGLGGASADAAAAVLACEAALGAALDDARRRALLAELGSDCSFFLDARGFARCLGRGERVEPIPARVPAWWVALVTPPTRCATAEVYRALRAPLSVGPFPHSLRAWPPTDSAMEARERFANALEEAALRVRPELHAWRDAFAAAGAGHFRLSGSGSSFFGLFDERREAEGCLSSLRAVLDERRLHPRLLCLTRALGRGATACEEGRAPGFP